jgi:hypothetical protein
MILRTRTQPPEKNLRVTSVKKLKKGFPLRFLHLSPETIGRKAYTLEIGDYVTCILTSIVIIIRCGTYPDMKTWKMFLTR